MPKYWKKEIRDTAVGTADQPPTLSEWIAKFIEQPAAGVEFLGFQAMPGHYYSEETQAEMDCIVIYKLNGKRESLLLGEIDTCEMLNEVFPPGQTKEET